MRAFANVKQKFAPLDLPRVGEKTQINNLWFTITNVETFYNEESFDYAAVITVKTKNLSMVLMLNSPYPFKMER